MSTIPVADVPLDAASPAQRLRRIAAAVRLHFTWWGVHKTLTAQQKEEVVAAYAADVRFLTAGKKIIDVRHEAFRKLTSLRTRMVNYWRGLTLPYTEPGVRLIRQSDIEAFVHTLQGFREELTQAEAELNAVYDDMKSDARRRLGRLYEPRDYPPEVRGLFTSSGTSPASSRPATCCASAPRSTSRSGHVAARFEEAVRLAEQAFAGEFARLLSHLARRLEPGDNGERRVFRDSAVTNLRDFFARFRQLNVRSNPELDTLVAEAQRLVQGLTPQDLRDDAGLRSQIGIEMARVQSQVESLITDPPRRRITARHPSGEGGGHAAAD